MYGTKEFYELMAQFEKDAKTLFYGHKIERVTREERPTMPADQFYNDGFVNQMFHAYMMGYQFHKSISQ